MCSFSFCHCASPTTHNAADATRGAGPSFSGAAVTSGGGGGVVVSDRLVLSPDDSPVCVTSSLATRWMRNDFGGEVGFEFEARVDFSVVALARLVKVGRLPRMAI
jgi:hypothetical protein